jgi:hypothetical protein
MRTVIFMDKIISFPEGTIHGCHLWKKFLRSVDITRQVME